MIIKPANIDTFTTNTIQSSLATTSLAETLACNASIFSATESSVAKEMSSSLATESLAKILMSENPMEKFFKEIEESRQERLRQIHDLLDIRKTLKEFNIKI